MVPAAPTWGCESMGHTIPHSVRAYGTGRSEPDHTAFRSYILMSVAKALAELQLPPLLSSSSLTFKS